MSQAWSEIDSSDENVKSDLSPKYPSPKKRRMMPKCARVIEKEFSPSLPQPRTTQINSIGNLLLNSIYFQYNFFFYVIIMNV